MSLKFYLDTHISKQVAVQLRNNGIDVVRCEEVGLAEASDEEHLAYAAKEGCILITKDDDFLRLHKTWLAEGKNHSGIFFSQTRFAPAVGEIVKACTEYYNLIKEGAGSVDEMHNQIIFI